MLPPRPAPATSDAISDAPIHSRALSLRQYNQLWVGCYDDLSDLTTTCRYKEQELTDCNGYLTGCETDLNSCNVDLLNCITG